MSESQSGTLQIDDSGGCYVEVKAAVTQEMITAGFLAGWGRGGSTFDSEVTAIYLAMRKLDPDFSELCEALEDAAYELEKLGNDSAASIANRLVVRLRG